MFHKSKRYVRLSVCWWALSVPLNNSVLVFQRNFSAYSFRIPWNLEYKSAQQLVVYFRWRTISVAGAISSIHASYPQVLTFYIRRRTCFMVSHLHDFGPVWMYYHSDARQSIEIPLLWKPGSRVLGWHHGIPSWCIGQAIWRGNQPVLGFSVGLLLSTQIMYKCTVDTICGGTELYRI